MSAAATLAASKLFGPLGMDVLEDVGRLMTEVSFAAGEVVFRQGEPGDQLVLVGDGELETLLAVPGGTPLRLGSIVAGEIAGELSLLGDGVRVATVRAVIPTNGWALARPAFDVLRHDVRHAASVVVRAIGNQAVHRLNDFYRRCAGELEGAPFPELDAGSSIGEVPPEAGEVDYLSGILFFRDFTRAQIVEATAGLPRLAVSRGALLTPTGERPGALWIVVRGAIETTMRDADRRRSLRLAGPGRAVGHIGLLGAEAFVEFVESRARERSILIEVPWPCVDALLTDDAVASRRFAAALWTDVVRALQHGQRPLAKARTLGPHRRTASGATPGRGVS